MASAAENITRHFQGDWHGSYGAIPTPGHSAKDRGTTVKMGESGEVLFHSHNDPSFDWRGLKDECRSLGLIPEFQSRQSVVNERGGWRETGSYVYRDASGAVAFKTVRKEKVGEAKRFEAWRLEGGQWQKGMGSVERVPYRLPEILAADPAEPVYFVEGERKADKLASWGLVATAIPFGAKGWRDGYARHLTGHPVVILPDNDNPGREFAEKVRAALDEAYIVDLPGLPAKGDVIDWTGTADDLRALVQSAVSKPEEQLPIADLLSWVGNDPAPKRFVLAGRVPEGEVTLLTGVGGANKSTFGQQLATCHAAGLPMLGIDLSAGTALYVTAEDDADRLHWMQAHICKAVGVPMRDLAGKLFLSSVRGRLNNELATFDTEGRIHVAPSFRLLRATITANRIRLVVLDNIAHLFNGNENDRGQVTAFVNLIYSLCLDLGVTVVLLGHPNKSGASYSGSTAWLNAVRSQLVLEKPEGSFDPDERILTVGKANYARPDETLAFRWHDFALIRDADLPTDRRAEIAAVTQASAENEAFMSCLRQRAQEGEGRAVGPSPGPNYAPSQFEGMTQAKGFNRATLKRAMDRLFSIGRIETATVRNATKGRDVTVLVEVAAASPNASPNASRTPFPNHPERHPEPPPAHTPPYGGSAGAASRAAAPAENSQRVIFGEGGGYHRGPILAPGESMDDPVPGWDA